MAVFPKQNAILLQLLHHFTTCTLLFKVMLQHRTLYFALISETWKTWTSTFP